MTTNTVTGTAGNDTLFGTLGSDEMSGEAGDDLIGGLDGDDTLWGNDGNDLLAGGGGNDVINGGNGIDFLRFGDSFGVNVDLARGTSFSIGVPATSGEGTDTVTGVEGVNGTWRADVLAGDDGPNILLGNGGDDLVFGRGGDDRLELGLGMSTVTGGPGNDTILSLEGIDTAVYSGRRSEYTVTVVGTTSRVTDSIANRDGADVLEVINFLQFSDGTFPISDFVPPPPPPPPPSRVQNGTSGPDGLYAGKAGETLNGFAGDDRLFGSTGNDLLNGGDGNDVLRGDGGGNDTFDGGNGVDILDLSLLLVPLTLDLRVRSPQNIGSANLTLLNIENLTGGQRNDLLTGDAGANRLEGSAGDDTLDGGGGADQLLGGTGNDTYRVDNAADVITEFGSETDLVISIVSYTLPANVENLTLAAQSLAALSATGNELGNVLTGNEFANLLEGRNGNDTLSGGGGADSLKGGAGNDVLQGDAGIDTAVYGAARINYTAVASGAGFTVVDTRGLEGTDVLASVERVAFIDSKLALDLSGNAGVVAKIIGAVLGSAAVGNKETVGIGLGMVDAGRSTSELVSAALGAVLGPAPGNAALVDLLYTNLVGSAPSSDVRAQFIAQLEQGTFTQTSLTWMAANHQLNLDNIRFTGLAASGLEYV